MGLFTNRIKTSHILLIILSLTLFLRVYKLATIPPSLNWDEAAATYNAYSISNWGKDEYGKFMPLVFENFGDDKHPVHIYATAQVIRFFGLSDFTARLSSALLGTMSVLILFYLARVMFKSNRAGLFAALFLALSPYHIHFSRGLWEVTFALFFFLFGLLTFYRSIEEDNNWMFPLACFLFGVSLYSYHSSKVVVPLMLTLLSITYLKVLLKNKKGLLLGIVVFGLFIVGMFFEPGLLGLSRIEQTKVSDDLINNTRVYQATNNRLLAQGEVAISNYKSHFTPEYLFTNGDQSPRNSQKETGQYFVIEGLLFVAGVVALLLKKRKVAIILFTWLAISVLPSAFVAGAPNATRAMYMMGVVQLVAGFGAAWIVGIIKNERLQRITSLIIVGVLIIEAIIFVKYYVLEYSRKDAIEWQYGMKQIVEYVKEHPEYDTVYMTKERSQPYIFFLHYLEYPLPELLKTVKYDKTDSYKYNTVESFDRYNFGNWEPRKSPRVGWKLYILTPNQYDGLWYRDDFEVKKVIKYPDGGDAYYIVSTT